MFWDYGGDNDSELISVIIDNTKGEEYDNNSDDCCNDGM